MKANTRISRAALLMSAVAGLLSPAAARAQASLNAATGPGPLPNGPVRHDGLLLPRTAPVLSHPWGGGFAGGNFVGTAQSTALHGQADVLRSLGQRNLLNAEALRSLQAARSHALDNSLKALEIRQERQRLGRARLAEQRQERKAALERSRDVRDRTADEAPDVEVTAAGRLNNARSLLKRGQRDDARKWLTRLTEEYPETEAAAEAAELLIALR